MPTTFDQAFAPLLARVGAASFLELTSKVTGLSPGRHAVTVIDWSALSREQRAQFTECLAMPLREERGRDWHAQLTPIAVVGGENHPIEDFDEQGDGILLLDLAAGDGATCPVVFFASPDGTRTYPLAATVTELVLGE
ncbi:MAG: hypothetical protein K8W52_12145 [Deltaproteobacteria bacterium]|nr:hypothetical protein [Deltaproteobacteria bacterium]